MQLTGLLRLINYNFFSKYKLKKYPIFTGQKLGQVTLFSVMSCPEGTKIFKCMSCPVREIKNICPILKIQDRTGIADPWMPQHFPGVLGSSFAYSQLSAIIQFQISCAVQNGID